MRDTTFSSDAAQDYALWPHGREASDRAGPPIRVAVPLIPQASFASVASFYEDFRAFNTMAAARGCIGFDCQLVSETPAPFETISGARILPDGGLPEEKMDVVLLPVLFDDGCLSDPGYLPVISPELRAWICAQHAEGAIFSAFCSGVLVLADAGVLDGYACTLPEAFAKPFRIRFPHVDFRARQSLVVSGPRREFIMGGDTFYSSDVSLYTIRRFVGAQMAVDFAKLYGKTFTDTLFASEISDISMCIDKDVGLAQRFIQEHLTSPGLVAAAAAFVGLSPRTFHRRFQMAVGLSPQDYVLHLRMQFARHLLVGTGTPIEVIAERNGYSDRAAFSRIFRKQTGVSPADYRARFRK